MAASLIRIEPLDGHAHHLDTTALPILGPLFDLPALEDKTSGSDRLLGSLKRNVAQRGATAVQPPVTSTKGKEKQIPHETIPDLLPNVWQDVVDKMEYPDWERLQADHPEAYDVVMMTGSSM